MHTQRTVNTHGLTIFFVLPLGRVIYWFTLILQGNVWAGAIGASLQYGTIQAKMFRVYVIFRRPAQKNIVSSIINYYFNLRHRWQHHCNKIYYYTDPKGLASGNVCSCTSSYWYNSADSCDCHSWSSVCREAGRWSGAPSIQRCKHNLSIYHSSSITKYVTFFA